MNPNAKASITWIPEVEGGRAKPPYGGDRYVTIVRFDQDQSWPEQAWSLVLELQPGETKGLKTEGTIYFLVEQAPHHLLRPGQEFGLYEGRRLVARGRVVG